MRIKSTSSKVKSQLGDRKNNVVYEIPCFCGAVYIGHTERAVGIRHQEHENDLRLTRTDLEADENERAERRIRSSRLVQHCVRGCGLTPDWDQSLRSPYYSTSAPLALVASLPLPKWGTDKNEEKSPSHPSTKLKN
jgi:hypothetical protein